MAPTVICCICGTNHLPSKQKVDPLVLEALAADFRNQQKRSSIILCSKCHDNYSTRLKGTKYERIKRWRFLWVT